MPSTLRLARTWRSTVAGGPILEADHAHPAARLADRRPARRAAGHHPAGRRDLDVGGRPGRVHHQGQGHLVGPRRRGRRGLGVGRGGRVGVGSERRARPVGGRRRRGRGRAHRSPAQPATTSASQHGAGREAGAVVPGTLRVCLIGGRPSVDEPLRRLQIGPPQPSADSTTSSRYSPVETRSMNAHSQMRVASTPLRSASTAHSRSPARRASGRDSKQFRPSQPGRLASRPAPGGCRPETGR